MKTYKQIRRFLLFVGLLLPQFVLTQRNVILSGEILHADQHVGVIVFQKTMFGRWKESNYCFQQVYFIKIRRRKDVQVWFKMEDATKILLIPRNSLGKQLILNVDFDNTSSVLIKNEQGRVVLEPLDLDFVVLSAPFEFTKEL